MSLQKKARRSLLPVRAHINRLTEIHAEKGVIDETVVADGLVMSRIDEYVFLDAYFTGFVGGAPTAELVTMTFDNFADEQLLPEIRSEWQKGQTGSYRFGLHTFHFGARGNQAVSLRRYPQYAEQFLGLLSAGHELEQGSIRELPGSQ